jgi:hypothetical protein
MLIWKMENNILEDVSDPTHCSLQKKSPIGSAVQLTNSVKSSCQDVSNAQFNCWDSWDASLL